MPSSWLPKGSSYPRYYENKLNDMMKWKIIKEMKYMSYRMRIQSFEGMQISPLGLWTLVGSEARFVTLGCLYRGYGHSQATDQQHRIEKPI